MSNAKRKRPEVRINPNTYQPNKSEFESGLRVKSSFDKAVKSLVMPAEVKPRFAVIVILHV